jgi:hypothetical protein
VVGQVVHNAAGAGAFSVVPYRLGGHAKQAADGGVAMYLFDQIKGSVLAQITEGAERLAVAIDRVCEGIEDGCLPARI